MILSGLALAAILSLRNPPPVDIAEADAFHIASAVAEEDTGWTDAFETIALVAIERTETNFGRAEQSCKRKGALGEIGSWQVMPIMSPWPAWLVCWDPTLQARSALVVLGRCRKAGASSMAGAMRCYASGNGGTVSDNATAKIGAIWFLAHKHGVELPQ